jgi:hypothetical protein
MSETWFVYTDLDARTALAVADAANEAIGAWLAEHDGGDEDRVPELGLERGALEEAAEGLDRALTALMG